MSIFSYNTAAIFHKRDHQTKPLFPRNKNGDGKFKLSKKHKHNKDQSTNFQCDYIIFYSWILFDCVFFYVTGKHLITSTIARNRHNSNFVVYNIINNRNIIVTVFLPMRL